MVSTFEQMQVPNGTGPDNWRSKLIYEYTSVEHFDGCIMCPFRLIFCFVYF